MEKQLRIKTREELLAINRSAAARELSVNVSSVSRMLSGERNPRVVTLKHMADYLGLSLDKLYDLLELDKM